ncbi:MAG TPA: hypothetical protein VG125_00505 [Pirellulales bacterium]|nr:hypothetical protein [Pirellulales bacterium]
MRSAFHCRAVVVVFFMALSATCQSDEPTEANAARRQRRLEFLEAQTKKFQIEVEDRDTRRLERGEQPVLRWSNPVRNLVNDGVTFLFLEGKRPRALLTVWVRSREASLESGEMRRELISLSAERLTCRRDGEVVWSPKTGGLVDQTFADAPSVASRPSQRLTQMRELARRFRAATYKPDVANELRLLSQPLYRYPNETTDMVDGALFAFTEGNDPEALLLLETVAVDSGKRQEWRYTLARSTSYRVVVQLDGREVFAVDRNMWQTDESPYVEVSDGPFTLRGSADDPQR